MIQQMIHILYNYKIYILLSNSLSIAALHDLRMHKGLHFLI